MLPIEIALVAAIVAMLIYFLHLNREIASFKHERESMLREVKEMRQDMGNFLETVNDFKKNDADSKDAEIKRCHDGITKIQSRLQFIESHYEPTLRYRLIKSWRERHKPK